MQATPDISAESGTQWLCALHELINPIYKSSELSYERPRICRLCVPKGGSGKSTLTALTASYLHYVEGVDVTVVDCDSRQYTRKDYRDHDIVVINETPALKKTFMNFYKRFDKQPYEILYSTPATAIEQAEEYMKDYPVPKVVFFDITGTINDMDLVNLLARMHYLFIPITTDNLAT